MEKLAVVVKVHHGGLPVINADIPVAAIRGEGTQKNFLV